MGCFRAALSVEPGVGGVTRAWLLIRVRDSGSWPLVSHRAGLQLRYCIHRAESGPIRVSMASGRGVEMKTTVRPVPAVTGIPPAQRSQVTSSLAAPAFRA